jgi:hypothetical protein
MPLKWTIDHAARMVAVAARGEVTPKQAEECLEAVVAADPTRYAKVLDDMRRCIDLAAADRPVQICKTVGEAKTWLAEQVS